MEYEARNWYILYNTLPKLVDLADDLEFLSESEIKHPLELIRKAEGMLRAVLKSKEPKSIERRINL